MTGRRLLLAVLAAGIVFVAAAGASASRSADGMGLTGKALRPIYLGYYDGHKDAFLNTDVSDKAQASMMHINYSAALGKVPKGTFEEIYLVEGSMAKGQLPVFSSEPGEPTYSPLWTEMQLTWKAAVTPVLLTSDTQIEDLLKKGDLTERETHVILSCPIVKVGK